MMAPHRAARTAPCATEAFVFLAAPLLLSALLAASALSPCGSDASTALECVSTTIEEGASLVQARSLAAARSTAPAAGAGAAAADSRVRAPMKRAAEICKNDTRLANQDLSVDIVVPEGELCIIQHVTLQGAIKAEGSVVLIGCNITGGLEVNVAKSGTTVEIIHTKITGTTKIMGGSMGAGPLLIRDGSSVGTVEAQNIGHIRASNSSVAGIKVKDFNMGLAFRDVHVGDGIELSGGAGEIDLWSTKVDGGLGIDMCKGCSISTDFQTELHLGLEIKESSGSLRMLGTNAAGVGEVSVSGLDGSVWLESMEVGGIWLEGVSGHIYLCKVTTDGASTISKSTGTFVAEFCDFHAEFKSIAEFEGLAIKSCNFGTNCVAISGNVGPILLDSNKEMALFLEKNLGVTLDGNDITTATISGNEGAVVIRNNTFQDVKCTDNAKAPTMQGNTVGGTSHGQCDVKV